MDKKKQNALASEDEEWRRFLLNDYGLDLGSGNSRLDLPQVPKRMVQKNGRRKLVYKDFSVWLRKPGRNMDYNLELEVVKRWFWIDKFWKVVFTKLLAVSGHSKEGGFDILIDDHEEEPEETEQDTNPKSKKGVKKSDKSSRYFQTPYSAPLTKTLSTSPFDVLRESIKIFKDIGSEAYCFAVQAERKIENLQEWKNLTSRLVRECFGPDQFWPISVSSLKEPLNPGKAFTEDNPFDTQPHNDDGWGSVFIFPFPYTVIFIPDNLTEKSSNPVSIYSFALVLPKAADQFTLDAYLHKHGYASVEEYISEPGHSLASLRENRVKHDFVQMRRLLLLNSENKQVRWSKECREDLKSLHKKSMALPSSNVFGKCWSRNRLLVLTDAERHFIKYERSLVPLQPSFRVFTDYPLLSPSASHIEDRRLTLSPGLHVFFEVETPRGGIIKKLSDCLTCSSNSSIRMGFNNERIASVFEAPPDSKDQKSLRQFFENTTTDRRKELLQLRSDVAGEFENRSSQLPHSFLADVLFNPNISRKQFMSLNILFKQMDLFWNILSRAIDFQTQLSSLSPRSFIWFMFWMSFYYRHKAWVKSLPPKSMQLLTPFFSAISPQAEDNPADNSNKMMPLALSPTWNDLESSQVPEFLQSISEIMGAADFVKLTDRLKAKVQLKDSSKELSSTQVLKRLCASMHDDDLPQNWESAMNDIRLVKSIYPTLDAVEAVKARFTHSLGEYVRNFQVTRKLNEEEEDVFVRKVVTVEKTGVEKPIVTVEKTDVDRIVHEPKIDKDEAETTVVEGNDQRVASVAQNNIADTTKSTTTNMTNAVPVSRRTTQLKEAVVDPSTHVAEQLDVYQALSKQLEAFQHIDLSDVDTNVFGFDDEFIGYKGFVSDLSRIKSDSAAFSDPGNVLDDSPPPSPRVCGIPACSSFLSRTR